MLFVDRSEPVGDRDGRARRRSARSLSGGRGAARNERQKYENQRRADEQERGRLEQRLTALDSQAELKERQLGARAGGRDAAAARASRKASVSWLDASRPKLEAERLDGELEQVRAEAPTRDNAAGAAALRDGVAPGGLRRDRSAASARSLARAHGAEGHARSATASRDGNALTVAAPCAGTIVKLQ